MASMGDISLYSPVHSAQTAQLVTLSISLSVLSFQINSEIETGIIDLLTLPTSKDLTFITFTNLKVDYDILRYLLG